jgi:anti-sigma B factor antagonist
MELSISIDARNGLPDNRAHIALNGHLDSSTAADFEQFVAEQIGEEITILVMDLEKLVYISSEGLRVLAKTRKLMRKRGGTTSFVNPSPQVRKVFEIVRAAPLNEVFTSIEELDAYLLEMQRKVSSQA